MKEFDHNSSHSLKGKWNRDFFKNSNPIILELGCGKGDYTLNLARLNKEVNYIGIDIKGARLWSGAKEALEAGLLNVAFLRTNIELIHCFFAPEEVSEIWLTFPDPQMKKLRKRLTATNFIENYRKFLIPEGIVHLKTDSQFQFLYTKYMCEHNHLEISIINDDIYKNGISNNSILNIKTQYEKQWLDRGLTIKYISFKIHNQTLFEPEVEIEFDDYRSFNRSKRSTQEKGV